jgi:hypothetical protein
MRSLAIPAFLAILIPFHSLSAQAEVGAQEGYSEPPASESTNPLVLYAVRIQGDVPVIDGLLDDAAWGSAPVAGDFVQLEPDEGQPATERSEVRVLYGPDALYVAFQAWDSRPDSIAAQLTRRDQGSYSDAVHVIVDSYFDRRTAFHFGVNPVGVKTDLYRFDDTQDDRTWDAVWDVSTRIGEDGWTAEFRIPYSQLRFGNHDNQTWGINFAREIARKQETATWAPIRLDDAAIVSKFGELRGLRGLGSPTRLELRPFSLARLDRAPADDGNPFYEANAFGPSAGLDLKYGVTNDLTLDVTVNPDFGQVEADPARVNLTAFETYFPEQRPFFIEGAAIFNFGIGVGGGDQGEESLFYSRRIGRPPQGWVDTQGGHSEQPERTTILGAWKLSGKTQSGWSIGLLHSVTAEETARIATGTGTRLEEPIEPLSNFGVARIQKDFRDGKSALGFIGTVTKRDGEVSEELGLRSSAYTGGFDLRHRFGANDRYLVSGFVLGSHVRGSENAIAATQRGPSRYFQRPDATHTDYDPTRTSLTGWAAKLDVQKVGGGFWNWGMLTSAKSPGFEINDLGYQREADLLLHVLYTGYNHYQPSERLRRWNLGLSHWNGWSFGGERLARGVNLNGSMTLLNYWGGRAMVNLDFPAWSDGTLRGGPLLRRGSRISGSVGFFSDERKAVRIEGNHLWGRAPENGSSSSVTSMNLRWRPSGRASVSVGPFFAESVEDLQWVQRVRTEADHYVFGRIDQETFGITGRFDFTFTPDLSLQLYAQPFVSAGAYSDFKEVIEPRAKHYVDRIKEIEPDTLEGRHWADLDGNGTDEGFRNPDFNVQQFRSTAVLRWEYLPGSLLYLVWSQGRNFSNGTGELAFGEDLRNLFDQAAENVFMVKLSYWISP